MKYQTKNLVVYDLEVYSNFFLCGLMTPDGIVTQFEDKASLVTALNHIKHAGYELCGFNSGRYDDPVMSEFIRTDSIHVAYVTSKGIINDTIKPWNIQLYYPSVDLMPLLPGRMSLKQVGVRLYHKKLQELPIAWDKELTPTEKRIIRAYNINDLEITRKLLDEIQPELDLRGDLSRQYSVDLRSKGDSGIAEEVISQEVGGVIKRTKADLKRMAQQNIADNHLIKVSAPSWWDSFAFGINSHTRSIVESQSKRFDTPIPLNNSGRLALPPIENLYLDDKYYAIGAGGLHSIDGPGSYEPNQDEFLVDIDVISYYPKNMLTNELFPRHMGQHFGDVFQDLVEQRLTAKRAGDKVTADRLKITINGTFGKTSDPYSALYDPQVTASTTIIGQVSLLILIAMLADTGLKTVSANTDGITVIGHTAHRHHLENTVMQWEAITGFNMEYTEYAGIYYRDVNNYIANVAGGKEEKQKTKGVFAVGDNIDLRHALKGNIIAESVKRWLVYGTPMEDTIRECTDINQFLLTHSSGKAFKCKWWGNDIGGLVRFYKSRRLSSTSIDKIHQGTGKVTTVPQSDNCVPLQDLPDSFPEDLDYNWYVTESEKLYDTIAPKKRTGMNAVAESIKSYTPSIRSTSPSARRSTAAVVYGDTDFNSMAQDECIGIATGREAGMLAVVDAESGLTTNLYRFKGNLPTKTRKLVARDHGFELVYGGAVIKPANLGSAPLASPEAFYKYYTPAELRKAGVLINARGESDELK